jgi:hypothetical protein
MSLLTRSNSRRSLPSCNVINSLRDAGGTGRPSQLCFVLFANQGTIMSIFQSERRYLVRTSSINSSYRAGQIWDEPRSSAVLNSITAQLRTFGRSVTPTDKTDMFIRNQTVAWKGGVSLVLETISHTFSAPLFLDTWNWVISHFRKSRFH